MKLLLTSNGLSNQTIINALQSMLDKPISECKLVFVPTAANPSGEEKGWLIDDLYRCKQAGFRVYLLDLAVHSLTEIKHRTAEADVLLFGGGDTKYLMEWFEKSGLKNILPELLKTKVYVGISAGSMVTAPIIKTTSKKLFNEDDDKREVVGLGLVNFNFRPHLGSDYFPRVNKENMDRIR